MTAYIQVRNIPHRRFKGTVRRVALLPDAQASWMNPDKKVFPTDILVDEELPILKPGVSASAEVIITNLTKVLSVPIQTVARWNGENVCFIKKGSRVTPVPVTTGWFNDAFVEITSGLKEGDLVLLAPASDEEDGRDGKRRKQMMCSRPQIHLARSRWRNLPRKGADSSAAIPSRPKARAAPERPRNRQGSGRRPQNSQNGPE